MLQSINFVLANELYNGKPIASLTKYSKVEVDNATFETFIIELNNPTSNQDLLFYFIYLLQTGPIHQRLVETIQTHIENQGVNLNDPISLQNGLATIIETPNAGHILTIYTTDKGLILTYLNNN